MHPFQPWSTPTPVPFNIGNHHLLSHMLLIHALHMPKLPQHTLIHSNRLLPSQLCSPPHFLISCSVPQCQCTHTPQTPHLRNIQLPPLCFFQAPCSAVGTTTPSYNILASTPRPSFFYNFLTVPSTLLASSTLKLTSTSTPPSLPICDPRYLKWSTSSNISPFKLTFSLHPSTCREQCITLLLFTFTFTFLLSHTLPNSSTNFCNLSFESATNAVLSTNRTWHNSHPRPSSPTRFTPFPSALAYTFLTSPFVYKWRCTTIFHIQNS